MTRTRFGALLAGALALASSASAQDSFPGTYQLTGKYSNQRQTRADVSVATSSSGALTVTRKGKYTAQRWRNVPEFTWSGDGRVDGDALKVTYRLSTTTGLVGVLPGSAPPANAGDTYVLEATYRLSDSGRVLEESITNTTVRGDQAFWRTLTTKGARLSGETTTTTTTTGTPPTAAVDTGRVKLGGELAVKPNGRYTVVLPTDGTLTLTVSSGTVKLEDPTGKAIDKPAAASLTYDVDKKTPVLGAYVAIVEGSGADARLTARFVQDGRVDPRIRPWSSHTYYPVYEFSYGTSPNDATLYRAGGPMEKFDLALALSGKQRAVWAERGGDYRTGFGFESGAYTRVSSPSEKTAEKDWYADLDGDGTIEQGDAATAFTRFDANHDGKVDRTEATAQLYVGAVRGLWRTYDKNGDDKVDATEIFASFVTDNDADRSGGVDFAEFDKAVRAKYDPTLASRAKPGVERLFAKDKNADGSLDATELGTPGAVDFVDSSDVDGDFVSFFDRDNVCVTLKNGTKHFGNRIVEENGNVTIYKGRKKDALVATVPAADVASKETGIADGDLDDSYSVGWWGHCNAWSMASIIFRKPDGDLTKNGQTFNVRDQKGLMVAYGMGDTEDSTFWWQQWGGDEIPVDKYAAGFHDQIHRWLRIEQQGCMGDMDLKNPNNSLNFQVWNYPIIGYVATLTEAAGGDPYTVDVSTEMEKGSYSDDDASGHMTVTYRLQFSPAGAITTGDGSKTRWQPDKSGDDVTFIRYLIHPFRFLTSGAQRNPNVTIERLQQLFGDKLKYNRIEDLPTPPANLPPPGQ